MATLDELMDIHRMQTARGPALQGAYPTADLPLDRWAPPRDMSQFSPARPFFPGVKPASKEKTERPASELADPLVAEGAARAALAAPGAMMGGMGMGAGIGGLARALGGIGVSQGAKTGVQRAIDMWKQNRGRAPTSDSDWKVIEAMARNLLRGDATAKNYAPGLEKMLERLTLGTKGNAQVGNQLAMTAYEDYASRPQGEKGYIEQANDFIRSLPRRGYEKAMEQFQPRPRQPEPENLGGSPMMAMASSAPQLTQALPGLLQQLSQATQVQPNSQERMALEQYLMSL